MSILKKFTYKQKENFLIDCEWYSAEDFKDLSEIGLDNIILDNNLIKQLEWFYS